MDDVKITPELIRSMKGRRKVGALTAYDYPTARLLGEAGVPLILVGDSLGMVCLGFENTTFVTLSMMEHHVRAAANAHTSSLLVADLPYRTYEDPAMAVESARRLMAAGGEAVKAEGGQAILPQVEAIVAAGIPFVGHLGMLPQSILEEGGYRIKGKTGIERDRLVEDARALEHAGAFCIVLELVAPATASEITRAVGIPTIGIGSGPDCDGQILVTPDLVGMFPWFTPRHVKPLIHAGDDIRTAVQTWLKQLNPS